MIYFDNEISRRNTNCSKWDTMDKKYKSKDLIHLGVADMDFKAPPAVIDALKNCIEHGIFGYTDLNDDFYTSFIGFMKRHHNTQISKEEVVFCPRINIAASIFVNCFTKEGDEVIIHTPAYNPLYQAIVKNKCNVIESPLKYKNDSFEMDFDELEKKVTEKTKAMIFCNPQNPTGRVWKKDELEKVSNFCIKHDLILFSDEIHGDILSEGLKFTSMLSMTDKIRERLIVATSPAKTFNIPSIIFSYLVIPNEKIRNIIKEEIDRIGMHNPNAFVIPAAKAAYNDCDEWYKNMLSYINENDKFTREYFSKHMPKFKICKREGTYLLWIDYMSLNITEEELEKWFLEKAKVSVYMGTVFQKAGNGFIRVNIATSKSILMKAYEQMKNCYNLIG